MEGLNDQDHDVGELVELSVKLTVCDVFGVVSSAVKYSEGEGKVTVEAMEKSVSEQGLKIEFSTADQAFIDSPQNTLKEKQHTGAPSAESVQRMIQSQQKAVDGFEQVIDEMKLRIQAAQDRCFSR